MAQDEDIRIQPFTHAAGGWTSVKEVSHALTEAHIPLEGSRILLKQNKPDGFACVSCSWAKPADPHPAEFCEHGAKATAWELTTERCTPEFCVTCMMSPGAHCNASLSGVPSAWNGSLSRPQGLTPPGHPL